MTKKTIRHHIIASAAHDGEPGVIAKSQKPAPSIKLSKEMHPVVVLVASGSTLYSFITIAIYMLCVQKYTKNTETAKKTGGKHTKNKNISCYADRLHTYAIPLQVKT